MVLRVGEGLVVESDGRLSISLPEFLLAGKHAGINEIVVEVRHAFAGREIALVEKFEHTVVVAAPCPEHNLLAQRVVPLDAG